MAGVLIADDASFMRNVLKRIVLQAGHDVIAEAGSGDEAIVMYRQHRPDLVLMDIVSRLEAEVAEIKAMLGSEE